MNHETTPTTPPAQPDTVQLIELPGIGTDVPAPREDVSTMPEHTGPLSSDHPDFTSDANRALLLEKAQSLAVKSSDVSREIEEDGRKKAA